jgi:hypothetical protein
MQMLNVSMTILQEQVQIVFLFAKEEHLFYFKLLLRTLIGDET